VYLSKSILANPQSAEINANLGSALKYLCRRLEHMTSKSAHERKNLIEKCDNEADWYTQRAEGLGIVRLPNTNYLEEQRKAQKEYREK